MTPSSTLARSLANDLSPTPSAPVPVPALHPLAHRHPWAFGDPRANNFDFIRLVLATLVILSHSYPLGMGTEYEHAHEPFYILTRGQMSFGHVAVDWFFVISGFLILQSWDRSSSIKSYFEKRIKRIYPGFIVVMGLCAWVLMPLIAEHGARVFSLKFLIHFLGQTVRLRPFDAQGTFAELPFPNVVNGSMWTIQYEFWCYIGVAALGLLSLYRWRWAILALYVLSLVVKVPVEVLKLEYGARWFAILFGGLAPWARLAPVFLAGMVFYLYRDRIPLSEKFAALCLVMLVIGARVDHGMMILWPTFGAYLVMFLAYWPRLRLHHVAKHGDFSYGVYLYAFPIQQLVVKFLGPTVNPWIVFGLATPMTFVAGFFSWHLVEKHFLKRGNHGSGSGKSKKPAQEVAAPVPA